MVAVLGRSYAWRWYFGAPSRQSSTLKPMSIAEEFAAPCQPRVLALLMRELLIPVPNLRRINQLFACDPVLAAQLMARANSPAFQMVGAVRGLPQAITLLGERQLRAVLKTAQASVAARTGAAMDWVLFNRLSHACAQQARSLAGWCGLDTSACYMAALLHGVGQIALHQSQPEAVAFISKAIAVWDPRRPRWEMRHWGYSACHTSAALLRHWHLPADVVTALQAMEAPMEVAQFDPMAGVLHLAVWSIRAKHSGWNARQMADAFPVEVALALGIDVDVVLQQEATDWRKSMY